jgi:hypothetical protein
VNHADFIQFVRSSSTQNVIYHLSEKMSIRILKAAKTESFIPLGGFWSEIKNFIPCSEKLIVARNFLPVTIKFPI